VKGKLQQKVIIVQILMFAAAGPLGIGIGWGISGCPSLISGIFKAISAGNGFIFLINLFLQQAHSFISQQVSLLWKNLIFQGEFWQNFYCIY